MGIATLILLTSLVITVTCTDYCKLSCGDSIHTVCKRKPCGADPKCGAVGSFDLAPMDDDSRLFVLDVHNKLRQKVANGQETSGGNGEAADMHVLQYDKELEYVAQCWANNCQFGHDDCRKTETFGGVGQNVWLSYGGSKSDSKEVLESATNSWYSEIKDPPSFNHVSQILWAKTTHIGCARVHWEEQRKVMVVCNYGPAGNVQGASVYTQGKPCSECGALKCSTKYPGLCGDPEPFDQANTWTPPFGNTTKAGAVSAAKTSLPLIVLSIVFCVYLTIGH